MDGCLSSAAVRLGMWIWSPSGRVVSQLFILIKVFKRILRPVAFSLLHARTAPQASMCPERKKEQKTPRIHTHTHTRTYTHRHLLVCPSQDAVLSQMAVEERPECIGMGALPLQNTSAYWDLATGHQGGKESSWRVEGCFLCSGGSCWSSYWFGGCLKGSSGEFFTGVPSFLTGITMWFIKTLVEAVCEDSNVVWSVFRC